MAQGLECLLRRHEALGSISSTEKKKKRKEKRREK
jgi:hypothetical protein